LSGFEELEIIINPDGQKFGVVFYLTSCLDSHQKFLVYGLAAL
jgi:hypothetical protein